MKSFQSIGIILSYIWFYLASVFFGWKPFVIFFSFLLEMIVLTILFGIARTMDEKRNPRKYRKLNSTLNILSSMLMWFVMQAILLYALSYVSDPNQSDPLSDTKLLYQLIWSFVFIMASYSLRIFRIGTIEERVEVLQDNLLIQILILSAANVSGLLVISAVEGSSYVILLGVFIAVRIMMEIYFSRYIRFV